MDYCFSDCKTVPIPSKNPSILTVDRRRPPSSIKTIKLTTIQSDTEIANQHMNCHIFSFSFRLNTRTTPIYTFNSRVTYLKYAVCTSKSDFIRYNHMHIHTHIHIYIYIFFSLYVCMDYYNTWNAWEIWQHLKEMASAYQCDLTACHLILASRSVKKVKNRLSSNWVTLQSPVLAISRRWSLHNYIYIYIQYT